jgi:hypothetical protein
MVIGELKWTELAIKEVLGVTPRLMRPVSSQNKNLFTPI